MPTFSPWQRQHAIAALAVTAALISVAPGARANDGQLRVLLVSQPEQEEQVETLFEVLSAHLKDWAVELKIRRTDNWPDDEAEQAESITQIAAEEEAGAALWVYAKAHKFGLIIMEPGEDGGPAQAQVLIRRLPDWSTTWQADCEAIAAFSRAALMSWLVRDSKEASMRCANEVLQAMDAEKPPVECPPPCPPPEEPVLTLQSHSALSFSWALGTSTPMIGGALGIGLLFEEIVGWRTQVGFFSRKNEGTVSLGRVPLRFGPVLWLSIQRLGLGVAMEGISDFTRWSGPAPNGEVKITDRRVWGLGGSLLVRFRIVGDLYFWGEGGADFMDSKLRYLLDGEQIFEYTPVQPRVSFGFELHTNLVTRAGTPGK